MVEKSQPQEAQCD
jgi:hypothetical protein